MRFRGCGYPCCGGTGSLSPTKFYRKTLRRGGVLPRPREGQSPSPTHHKIRFRRGRCLHRPARAYTAPLVNGVIAKPVRTLAVAIRSPLDLHRGITDSHDQSADWSRNDRFIARGAVNDRRWSALSPPPMAKFSAPFHLHTGLYFPPISPTPPGEHPEKFMRLSDFPRSDIFSSCREKFFVLCSV